MSDRKSVNEGIVNLDYQTFADTDFLRCKLIFNGGRPPNLMNCTFTECEFIFEGPAHNTVMFMASIAHGGGGGAELIVNYILGLNWVPNAPAS